MSQILIKFQLVYKVQNIGTYFISICSGRYIIMNVIRQKYLEL